MLKTKIVLVLAAVSVTVGCSPKYQVKLDSKPQSARVVCNGADQGYAPVTLPYNTVPHETYVDASNCNAVWSSGVKATYPAKVEVSSGGQAEFTLVRPEGPGSEKDEKFNRKIQAIKRETKRTPGMDPKPMKEHPRPMMCSSVGGMETCL